MTAKRKTQDTAARRGSLVSLTDKLASVREPAPVACPHCGSTDVPVKSTIRTEPPASEVVKRYRLCRGCAKSFWSFPVRVSEKKLAAEDQNGP